MAGEKQEAPWPVPKFHFSVEFQVFDGSIGFQEVSGLDIEAQVIEYRSGNSENFSTVKMPGLQKSSNLTFKRGIFKGDKSMWEWFKKNVMNTVERDKITINLLDESHSAIVTWSVKNAWCAKLSFSDLKSDANEVAIDTMEVAHEGLVDVVYA